MRRSILAAIAVTFAISVQAMRAHADFTITVGTGDPMMPTDIAEGSTGFIDVFIKSTGGTPLPLASAGFTFNITPTDPMNTRTLQFVDLQPQDQPGNTPVFSSSYLNNSNYVFYNNSLDYSNPFAVGNVSSTMGGTKDQYDGGDNTVLNMGANILVPTTDVLLIRLSLTAALGSPPHADDTFLITMTTPSSGFQTKMDLDTGDREPYSTKAGTVKITSSFVPEPGSLALIIIGIPAAGWMVRRCKRREALAA